MVYLIPIYLVRSIKSFSKVSSSVSVVVVFLDYDVPVSFLFVHPIFFVGQQPTTLGGVTTKILLLYLSKRIRTAA